MLRETDIRSRTFLFFGLLSTIVMVGDGLPIAFGSPIKLQILLVPITMVFLLLMIVFLELGQIPDALRRIEELPDLSVFPSIIFVFELLFICIFYYETRHFREFGYRLLPISALAVFSIALVALASVAIFSKRVSLSWMAVTVFGSYVGAGVLAIYSFPLNYLRSDMLPVIFWADQALLAGQNPYQTFHVADRLYDFPYLPGMLLVFAPAQALHLDLRWATTIYVLAGMGLVIWATLPEHRKSVTMLVGLFVLNPYFQYRHDLYTQGHFFSLIVVFVLMQRRKFVWSAVVFGLSMVISQFSWVIFPFFLMNALRRGGWKEVGRMALLAFVAATLFMAPFLVSGAGAVARNSVGQWDNLGRAIARPMNFAFWASFVVKPSHLKWLQLILLTGVFCFCWAKGRCDDLADTLRWMIASLTLFILLNVLIDGYFYLMLLVPMLVYTCVANGWWSEPQSRDLQRRDLRLIS